MNHPEDILKTLALKPPSAAYQVKAQSIWQPHQGSSQRGRKPLWLMAAVLLLSLVLNVVQFQQSRHPAQSAGGELADGIHQTATPHAQNKRSGYSYVASDASPDGQHQSVTVTWENKS